MLHFGASTFSILLHIRMLAKTVFSKGEFLKKYYL